MGLTPYDLAKLHYEENIISVLKYFFIEGNISNYTIRILKEDINYIFAKDEKIIIGKGASSTVYKGMYVGTEVAIKKSHTSTNFALDELSKEAYIMRKYDNPRLLKCYGIYFEECAIVFELMEGTIYSKFINGKATLNWKLVYNLC